MIKTNSVQKIKHACFLFLTLCLFTQCKKEDSALPEHSEEIASANLQDSIGKLAATISTTTYNIEKALPSGYVKDGTKDYTTYIQKAISTYSNITFPAFPIQINDSGLKIGSDKIITFLTGSELRLKPSAKSAYWIFYIYGANNVTLNGPVIKGDRNTHLGTTGAIGEGIGIYSSTNITVNNAKVYDCWGDGIYVGRGSAAPVNKNIVIKNAYTRNNRRSGITITAVDGLKIDGSYCGYTNGASPEAGLNCEPNYSSDELKNISISNLTTEKNALNGLQIGFSKLYGGPNKSISISLLNHTDNGSFRGFYNTCFTTRKVGSETITGTVYVTNSVWKKNTYQMSVKYRDPNLKAVVANPKVITQTGTSYLSSTAAKTLLTDYFSLDTRYSLTFNY